jgi:hypothetical protein
MKTCPRCSQSEPYVEFGIATGRYDGKQPYCRRCWTLYIQEKRWANGTRRIPPFLERLWEGVQVCAHGRDCPFCCWPWLKARDDDGYGRFALTNAAKKHRTLVVTHLLWEVWHARPFPLDRITCHYCDEPSCCNVNHLWLGTLAQNRADCVAKGRQAKGIRHGSVTHPEVITRGETHYLAKLTTQDVLDIRALHADGVSAYQLSFRYPVSYNTVKLIVRRKIWRHI